VQQEVTIVNPDLPTFIIFPKYSNFSNVPVTKHGAKTSGTPRPQINAQLYTAYWYRGMAEYDG